MNNTVSESLALYGFTPTEQNIIEEIVQLRGHEDLLHKVLIYVKGRVASLGKSDERERTLREACGLWDSDKRSSEQILKDIRSNFSSEIIKGDEQ